MKISNKVHEKEQKKKKRKGEFLMSENNNNTPPVMFPPEDPYGELARTFPKGNYFLVCCEWDEIVEQPTSKLATPDNPNPHQQGGRALIHQKVNEVIDAHPIAYSIRAQMIRLNFTVSWAMIIKREHYDFVLQLMADRRRAQ
jgi:hypothetical protein